jgi:hypothetical protein
MERLPELRKTIESADSVMALWVELSVDFHRAYEQKPPNESLIARIYAYADWCVKAPRDPDAGRDPLSAVAVCFYEHIPTHKNARDDMPRWFRSEDVEFARATFSYSLEPDDFEELLKYLRVNVAQYRGREHRISNALEALKSGRGGCRRRVSHRVVCSDGPRGRGPSRAAATIPHALDHAVRPG